MSLDRLNGIAIIFTTNNMLIGYFGVQTVRIKWGSYGLSVYC